MSDDNLMTEFTLLSNPPEDKKYTPALTEKCEKVKYELVPICDYCKSENLFDDILGYRRCEICNLRFKFPSYARKKV